MSARICHDKVAKISEGGRFGLSANRTGTRKYLNTSPAHGFVCMCVFCSYVMFKMLAATHVGSNVIRRAINHFRRSVRSVRLASIYIYIYFIGSYSHIWLSLFSITFNNSLNDSDQTIFQDWYNWYVQYLWTQPVTIIAPNNVCIHIFDWNSIQSLNVVVYDIFVLLLVLPAQFCD